MKREFLQNIKIGDQALPKEIIDSIMEEHGRGIEAAKKTAVEPFADYESIKEQLQATKGCFSCSSVMRAASFQLRRRMGWGFYWQVRRKKPAGFPAGFG